MSVAMQCMSVCIYVTCVLPPNCINVMFAMYVFYVMCVIYTCMYVRDYVYMYVCIQCKYLFIFVCMRVRMYVCMHVCMHLCIYVCNACSYVFMYYCMEALFVMYVIHVV